MKRGSRSKGHWLRVATTARGLLAASLAAAMPFAAAHSPVDPAALTDGHPTGHVTDRADQTWPPQPRGISAVQLFSDPLAEAREREAERVQAEADERAALRLPTVVEALGRRYQRVGIEREPGKHGDTGSRRLVYFSHDRRATVEVAMDDAGVRAVRSTPAAQYQPEITDEESAQASALARAHFLALGRDRVARLQPFGILAYRPRGPGFYGTRVLYVSFHAGADAAPEYAAWVDLTRQRVLRIREERR